MDVFAFTVVKKPTDKLCWQVEIGRDCDPSFLPNVLRRGSYPRHHIVVELGSDGMDLFELCGQNGAPRAIRLPRWRILRLSLFEQRKEMEIKSGHFDPSASCEFVNVLLHLFFCYFLSIIIRTVTLFAFMFFICSWMMCLCITSLLFLYLSCYIFLISPRFEFENWNKIRTAAAYSGSLWVWKLSLRAWRRMKHKTDTSIRLKSNGHRHSETLLGKLEKQYCT